MTKRYCKLFALNAFRERKDDLIHVPALIENAYVPREIQKPIILPKNHWVTQIMIEDIQYNTVHVKVRHVVSELR